MPTRHFPRIALGIGIVLATVLTYGSTPGAATGTTLPLLTLLVVSEFAFIVTAIGAFIAFRQRADVGAGLQTALVAVVCAGLAVFFLARGVALWPL